MLHSIETVVIQSFFQKVLARKTFASSATLLMLNRVQLILFAELQKTNLTIELTVNRRRGQNVSSRV